MGWGTGLIGEKLAERGYTNIDGIEASPGILEVASEKNVYKNLEMLRY